MCLEALTKTAQSLVTALTNFLGLPQIYNAEKYRLSYRVKKLQQRKQSRREI
jgi:hypothetical protein